MEFEQGLQVIDDMVFSRSGRRLSPVEVAVLRGCWQDQTYDQIAVTTGYSIGYLNRTVAPKLWQTLSDAFSEKTGKKKFALCGGTAMAQTRDSTADINASRFAHLRFVIYLEFAGRSLPTHCLHTSSCGQFSPHATPGYPSMH